MNRELATVGSRRSPLSIGFISKQHFDTKSNESAFEELIVLNKDHKPNLSNTNPKSQFSKSPKGLPFSSREKQVPTTIRIFLSQELFYLEQAFLIF